MSVFLIIFFNLGGGGGGGREGDIYRLFPQVYVTIFLLILTLILYVYISEKFTFFGGGGEGGVTFVAVHITKHTFHEQAYLKCKSLLDL